MLNDLHVLESIPAYVLGSLEEGEARLVTEHLAGCTICRKELESYQTVADQLLLALPETTPPAELKVRLLEKVQRLSGKRAPQPARWRLPSWLFPVGASAGLLLIVALAVSNVMLWGQVRNSEVLRGPLGMRAITLQNTVAAVGASGFVIISADGQNGVLVVDQLPALDAAHEYQVWLLRDSELTSGAVFSVDESGYRGLRIVAPDSLLTYSSVRVTVEPKGGSTNPTGADMLTGSLFNP